MDGLVDALAQSAFTIMGVLTRVSAENDLSLSQLRVLAILRDRRLKMAELADYLGLEKSTMTGLVDRAEARGLLARAPHPGDGRAVDVFLTEVGEEFAAKVGRHVSDVLRPVTDALTPAEQRRLQSLLETLVRGRGPS
jgi:DNA-binding MarR family transcriptional regulator